MILHSPHYPSSPSTFNPNGGWTSSQTLPAKPTTTSPSSLSTFNPNGGWTSSQTLPAKPTTRSLKCNVRQTQRSDSSKSPTSFEESHDSLRESLAPDSFCARRFCSCGRRRFVEAIGTSLFSTRPSNASPSPPDPTEMLNSIHPPRPDWYEEFYAYILDKGSKSYEAEVADYKSLLFTNLRGKAKTVLEIGVGTGPNLKYYAGDNGVHVIGIDPSRKMEKYAQAAAVTAGLPLANFNFIQAVAEALPVSDASVDAVVGTLVLCSVKDVDMALKEVMRVLKPGGLYLFLEHVAAKDGTILRFVQGILDPLHQTVADGCHLTRKTGKNISEAGFSDVDINMAFFSSGFYVNPQVYGIACK